MSTNGTMGTDNGFPSIEGVALSREPGSTALLDAGEPGTIPLRLPAATQSFRELRYALEAARAKSAIRTVGIVSVGEGDGRSLTALNLALTLTAGGRRKVALVDACGGTGSIARLLGLESPPGLSDVLAGHMPLETALVATSRPGLFALAAGSAEVEPLDVLDGFAAVVERMAAAFDHVLVDTPALSSSVDAAALTSRLEGVLVVVRARRTRAPELERLLSRVGGTKVLGLVLNEARG